MLEITNERRLQRVCRDKGARCLKAECLGTGFPDRIVIARGGRVAFIELKRQGTKLRPAQRLWKKRLDALGHDVFTLDSPEAIDIWATMFFRNRSEG